MMMHNLERTLDEMMDKAKVEGKLEMIKKLLDLGIRDIPTLSKASDLLEEEIKKLRTN
ncbi:hypothetical protein [Aneurinibacillus uraniidurans]|uniref:hypothetical protein n=1 Tax=Aneurinibacillus uraniidurans TaxID=2966586 RepID=UPI0023497EC2|nr:hypothetical protein [Aneurinibacillus sp. B1]WCN36224.1 hypothetical protein PO771_09985 [Aneurinibacillus sp. B1]